MRAHSTGELRSVNRVGNPGAGGPKEAIFLLCALVVILTFAFSAGTLDLFVHYNIAGGGFLEKFHPASYVAAVLLAVLIASPTTVRPPVDTTIVKFLYLFSLLAAYLALRGIGAFAATIIDIYIAPLVLLLGLSQLDMSKVQRICALFVFIAVANGVVVLVDYVRGTNTIPFAALIAERFYRPPGLAGHPTAAAWMGVYAMFLVMAGGIRAAIRRPLILFFLVTIVVCKVRIAMFSACVLVIWNLIRPISPRASTYDYALDLGMVLLIPAAIVGAYLSGAFDRLFEVGLWDESAQTRFIVYDSLKYFTAHQLLYGISSDYGDVILQQMIGIQYNESSFVLAVFWTGVPFTCVLMVSVVACFWRFMMASVLFFLLFIVIAVGGHDLSVKNMAPAALALLGYFL